MGRAENIRDVVLPLVEVKKSGEDWSIAKFHGTCFLIGKRGYALTNKHLLGASEGNTLCALTVEGNRWTVNAVIENEAHPAEDVALLKLDNIKKTSFLQISSTWEGQTLPYRQFCYPEEIVNELVDGSKTLIRPDLVYLEGYIRRRLSKFEVLGIKGREFYELSEPGSRGCSGSPIIKKLATTNWRVVGIYVGSRKTQSDEGYQGVGYCVRADFLSSWAPEILGTSISDEY